MPPRLAGKRAIMSGAATGIGAATARRFVAEGATVALLDLNATDGAAVAREIGAAASFYACDVADPDAVRAAVDAAAGELGGLNIVFANAALGTVHVGGTVETLDPERWDLAFDVNARGVYALCRAALPHQRAMAVSYGPENIRVNALAPGFVRTRLTADVLADPARAAAAIAGIPLRRVAEPDELAACALFLASDDASFVTGATLVVDGGQTVV